MIFQDSPIQQRRNEIEGGNSAWKYQEASGIPSRIFIPIKPYAKDQRQQSKDVGSYPVLGKNDHGVFPMGLEKGSQAEEKQAFCGETFQRNPDFQEKQRV